MIPEKKKYLGNLVIPQIFHHLQIDHGWRYSLRVVGIAAPLVVLICGFITAFPKVVGTKKTTRVPIGLLLRVKDFQLLFFAIGCGFFGFYVPFVHMTPYSLDIGLSSEEAALMVTLMGAAGIVGRFGSGFVARAVGPVLTFRVIMTIMGISLCVWTLCRNIWTEGIFAVVYSASGGAFSGIIPAVALKKFGLKFAGTATGLLWSSSIVGYFVGAPSVGYIFDSYHTYVPGSLLVGLFVLLGAAVVFFVTPDSSIQDDVNTGAEIIKIETEKTDVIPLEDNYENNDK